MIQSWLDNLEDKIVEQREEIAELKQALLPLAKLDIKHMEQYPDDRPVYAIKYDEITLGDIRRAKRLVEINDEK